MAIKTIGDLKAFFETGDKPTQQQFWDWLESYRHVLDKIVWNDLDPALQAIILASGGTVRPERREITDDTSITILSEYRFVHLWIKNPSPYNLVFHLNYPALGPGDPWQICEVPANGKADFSFNKTFGVNTDISCVEVTGVDFSATPVILLIDRK